MAYQSTDFQCQECNEITEFLIDKNKDISSQDVSCEKCKSKNMKKIISISKNSVGHVSWSQWRVGGS